MHGLRSLAGLSAEQEQYLGVLDVLSEKQLAPAASQMDAAGSMSEEVAEALVAEGLDALGLPETAGGSGADRLTTLLALEAVAFGSAACAGRMAVSHGASALTAAAGLGPAGRLARIEIPAIEGSALTGSGWAESGLRPDGPLTVLAVLGEGLPVGWTVAEGASGIETEVRPARSGLRGAVPSPVALRGVPAVAASDEAVGEAMTWLLLGWAMTAVGVAGRALEDAVQHLRVRHQFSQALAERPALQAMVGEMEQDLLGAAAGVLAAISGGDLVGQLAAARRAGQMAVSVADNAVQLHGGYGYIRETRVERLLRDALSVRARIAGLGAVPQAIGLARLRQ